LHAEEKFVFGYEESFGFLLNEAVRDKDAFQPMARLLAIVSRAKSFNKTLVDLLEDCYRQYGYYQDVLLTKTLEGSAGLRAIQGYVDRMANYPLGVFLDQHIVRIENYITGLAIDAHGQTRLTLEKSDVIKFFLAEGGWLVFRPSGTEPKLKIYMSLTDASLEHLKTRFNHLQLALQQSLDAISI
jgi:phosphoglucomutase